MSLSSETVRIAIVGGGVAGLSTAYYLQKHCPGPLSIDIFEKKAALGGNAETVLVDLGDRVDADGPNRAYLRWADLGVNDVNLATYHLLKQVMDDIGYLQNMKPLQDTTSYFSGDGSLALTDDSALTTGVTDPRFSVAGADDGLLALLIAVVHRAAIDLLPDITPDYTVGEFFQRCIETPQQMLAAAALQLKVHVDWSDPALPPCLQRVRDDIYYPRISAMYFADERGPQVMPLLAPFEYYQLQEGGVAPDRRYFDMGAQTWLEALASWLTAGHRRDAAVRLHTDAAVHVTVNPGQVTLAREGLPDATFDLCVMATHADDAARIVAFGDGVAAAGAQLRQVLESIDYTFGYAVCHTYDGVMPPSRNIWRTYNVLKRSRADSVFPYRMSYVCPLHQNDPVNPPYNQAGLPQFFVSLVDDLNRIPIDTMLDRVQGTGRVHPRLFAALPRATQRSLQHEAVRGGYHPAEYGRAHPMGSRLAGKAWTMFKHNVLDAACYRAQHAIAAYNQATAVAFSSAGKVKCPLLFAGGWTNGAGLQEQCLQQSRQLVMWLGMASEATEPAADTGSAVA
ncbi:FAD-dependent oxidoreductase [Pseudoduganella sp. SL102]|uniref:NAD(P)-binding protein n=1 Tax=Pseudoduganella sp. SL102 TaxID=2995154 RepID=UPI00248B03FC|nr:NAD(P)-binding protein [Pseudoduganella sp. SL102]WBS00524.1 FAD-dependent oxidoreductase [Pseudoduganella sp. SL102]